MCIKYVYSYKYAHYVKKYLMINIRGTLFRITTGHFIFFFKLMIVNGTNFYSKYTF